MELFRIKRWAKRQLERAANRAKESNVWREYLERIEDHSKYSCKFALIKDEEGNPVPLADLSISRVRRHQIQLLTLRVV